MRYWRRGLWVGAVIATGAVAAVAVRDRSLEGVGPLLSVLGFFVSLAGLLHSTARSPAQASPDEQLDRSADALATAVAEQWRSEWRLRRLQDPEPLAVHWTPAPDWLSDLPDAAGRAPVDLAGQLTEITEAFGRLPSRRLVVLGAPGSGKTVLAVRFTLDLLDGRGADDPVPVLFQASTWQPDRQSLHEWLAESLAAAHPTLGAESPSGTVLAKDLVATGRIVPVMDGLDELPPPLRTKAVWRLNTELDTGSPLLLTCRSAVYAEVVEAGDVLTSAAVVELQPLGFEEAARFLVRTARPVRGPGGRRATSWDPVLDQVRHDPDAPASRCLRQVLSLPLMVAMARAVYGDTGTDPSELLHRPDLATPAALEQHLLDAFVPASFRTSSRYDAVEAVHWLRFLARHLERRRTRELVWWELHMALPSGLRAVAPLLLLGAVAELVCVAAWLAAGYRAPMAFTAAVALGLCTGHAALSRDRVSPRRKILLGLACVVPLGVAVGGLRLLSEDPYDSFPFANMDAVLGWLFQGVLYGVAVATALAAIGVTTSPTPATMPFPALRGRRYGRWVWKTVGGLVVGVVVLQLLSGSLGPESKEATLLAAAATGLLFAVYVVRGEGATPVQSADRHRGRGGTSHARRLGRALVQGLSLGLLAATLLGLAFGLAEGGTAAGRAVLRAEFPFDAPVHRTPDGGRYAVADDGTRYGVRPDGDTYITPAQPVDGAVFEESDFGTVFALADSYAPEDSCEGRNRCHRIKAVLEVSARASDDYPYYSVRLPDGRLVTGYDIEEVLDPRAWEWTTRQYPGELLSSGLSFGIVGGLALGIVTGFVGGLHRWLGTPVDIARTAGPLASLRTDRDTGIVRGFLTTIVGAVSAILAARFTSSEAGATAAAVFVPTALIAFALSAWGRLLTARLWLCTAGRLPWRLMAFLAEAHERGVLRQAGAVYQFRHARLQERLASGRPDGQES